MADDDTQTTEPPPPAVEDATDGTDQPARTFTQAELDAIVERRLAKERAKFADFDTFKAARVRLAEIEDAERTEVERAQNAAREADERAQQAESRFRSASIASAVAVEAAKAGADPDVILALIDTAAVELDDDGHVDGVADQVAALLEAKPYLRRPTAGSFDGGARGGTSSLPTFTRDQLRDPKFYAEHQAEILAAAKDGRITD